MTRSLEDLTDLPDGRPRDGASGDLLSHVLAQIRLTGDRVHANSLAPSEQLGLEPGLGHILIISEGALRAEAADGAVAVFETGDLALFPHGLGNTRLAASNAGATVIVCRFWFDPSSLRDMISALPRCIHIQRADGAGWLDGIVPFLMSETSQAEPGAALMISRIIDLIVIRTLRTWIRLGHTSGWLGALSDSRIARALKRIHETPMRRWSIDALAEAAGMSRSSFCERFTTLVGRSPLRYQNAWRLNLAREMLAGRDARVGEIGLRIGYESEAAFSRAFKAQFGRSPREELGHSSETKPAG